MRLTLVIVGQLLSSLAIDNFGFLSVPVKPVSGVKLAGAAVVVCGVLLTRFDDRIFSYTKFTFGLR